MLSLERTKELLNDPSLSDKEIQEIRDGFHMLVEIIFEKWKEDKKTGKLNSLQGSRSNKTKSTDIQLECQKNN
jgi:hypothetical protein